MCAEGTAQTDREEQANDESERPSISMDGSFKSSTLGAHSPDDPILFPDEWSGAQLLRLRLNFDIDLTDRADADIAYEHRAQYFTTDGAGAGAGVLPSLGEAPYRIRQLDWKIDESSDQFFYRHELDRASVTIQPDWGEVVIGRQAIGLGRGYMFSAVDMFSPFTPAEVDREWRRGVDALRIETRLSQTTSAEVIAVFGDSWDDSALLGRIRGFKGNVDGELVLGKRGEDEFVAGITSATVGDAAVHAELALFHTPESHPDGGIFGSDDLVLKAVLGSSYTFDVGNGLTLIGEYHYSGFGAKDTSTLTARLLDPVFQERALRGDFQTLGQHAVGVQALYTINESFSVGALVLNNPSDDSGLFSPSLVWDITDNSSMLFNAFLPWGEDPDQGQIQSEYGLSPESLFIQFSTYF